MHIGRYGPPYLWASVDGCHPRAVKSKPPARYPPNVSDEGKEKGNKKIEIGKKKKVSEYKKG